MLVENQDVYRKTCVPNSRQRSLVHVLALRLSRDDISLQTFVQRRMKQGDYCYLDCFLAKNTTINKRGKKIIQKPHLVISYVYQDNSTTKVLENYKKIGEQKIQLFQRLFQFTLSSMKFYRFIFHKFHINSNFCQKSLI